jgi:hypothetical protein
MTTREKLLRMTSQNLYETIRSLELAHERNFSIEELKTIIKNYYHRNSNL